MTKTAKYSVVSPYGRRTFESLQQAKKHAQAESARAGSEQMRWDNRDSVVYERVSPARADGLIAVAAYNEGRSINPDRY